MAIEDKPMGIPFPTLDFNAITESYRKNLEILGLINKMSVEVFNDLTKLQTTYMQQLMSDVGSVATAKPTEALAKMSEVARTNIVKAMQNGQQIANMMIANNNELTAAVTKRMRETVEETKNVVNNKK